MLLYGIYAAKYPLQNFVCQQHCPQPRVMKCTRFYITTILYIVSEMNVAAKQVDFISIRARLRNGNYGGGRFLLQERVAAHEVFIGGRRHGDHECFFGENENKFVLSCELRSGPVWVIFFPIISGTLHPHLCDYDQLAQPMSACEDLGMQRDEDRHFSSGGKTIG